MWIDKTESTTLKNLFKKQIAKCSQRKFISPYHVYLLAIEGLLARFMVLSSGQ